MVNRLNMLAFLKINSGLYVDNHHITLNNMYDEASETMFDSSPKWWNKAMTMWISTTLAKLRTRVYLWPGCEVPINGTRVEYCEKYAIYSWTNHLQLHLRKIVQDFAEDKADVGFIYCEQPDYFGHMFGPDSWAVKAAVRSLDTIIHEFLENIAGKRLKDKVNFIIVSDHGMISVGPKEAKKISLADYINLEDVKIVLERGAMVGIYPDAGKLESVYQKLKQIPGISVWRSEEIPEHYHFKLASTTAPIVILAHKGYYINGVPDSNKKEPSNSSVSVETYDLLVQGFHGYDADEVTDMRGIFLAMGPDFKKNYTLPPIFITDVYNLAMHVIGIPPLPNDGNWTVIEPALERTTHGTELEGSQLSRSVDSHRISSLYLIFIISLFFQYFLIKRPLTL